MAGTQRGHFYQEMGRENQPQTEHSVPASPQAQEHCSHHFQELSHIFRGQRCCKPGRNRTGEFPVPGTPKGEGKAHFPTAADIFL